MALNLKTEKSYKVVERRFCVKENNDVYPLCICGDKMLEKGTTKLVCRHQKCPLVIDRKALSFFVQKGYIDFNETDGAIHYQKVDIPICQLCTGRQNADHKIKIEVSLLSYTDEKTKHYPAYEGVVWRCSCPSNYRAGLDGQLKLGWKKFGPSIDNGGNGKTAASAPGVPAPFDFSALYKS